MNPIQATEYIKQHVTNDHVRLQIEEVPEWTQGYSGKDSCNFHSSFKDIQSPYSDFEALRKSARPTIKADQLSKVNLKEIPMNVTQCLKYDLEYVKNNTVYNFFMNRADSATTLLLNDSLETALINFKIDLANGLSNELQYYKVCGFSKRKTCLKIDALKDIIVHRNGNSNMRDEVLEYLAKRFKVCICLLSTDTNSTLPKRCDYVCEEHNGHWILIDRERLCDWPIEFDNADSLRSYIKDKAFPNVDDLNQDKLFKKTVFELKEIAKYFGMYKSGMTKDVLVKSITQM